MALLLDRGRFGIALSDDDAAQICAVLSRHLLPYGLAFVIAEVDRAAGPHRVQKDAPAVVGHLHVAEVGPAVSLDADGSAQIHVVRLAAVRPHVTPPVDEAGLPLLECALQRLVASEVDVVGNLLAADVHTLSQLKRALLPLP